MTESWFYRESADCRERGPVTQSDLDYLKTQGTLRPGMQVRSQFGEWTKLKTTDYRSRTHHRATPASVPRPPVQAQQINGATPPTSPPLPTPQYSQPLKSPSNQRRSTAIALAVGVLLLLLVLLLLSVTPNSDGLASRSSDPSNPSNSSNSSNSSKQGNNSKPSDSSNPSSPKATTTKPSPGDQQPQHDKAAAQVANVPTAQPLPLDRNVNQRHFISSRAEFFGLRAHGTKFVFLIDGSASMTGVRDAAARRELVAAIRRMPPAIQIEVIFFTNSPRHVFGGLTTVADYNDVIRKIESTYPISGSTPVLPSLRAAIQMQPDAVFLLTDGAFDEHDISRAVQEFNRGKIPINTVALQTRSAETILKAVSSQSGGDYRYVAK